MTLQQRWQQGCAGYSPPTPDSGTIGNLRGRVGGTTPSSSSGSRRNEPRLRDATPDIYPVEARLAPHCGGTLRVIASIEDPTVIETILAHIALRDRVSDAQPRAPPPAFDDNDAVHLF